MRVLTVGSLPPEWGGPVRGGVATFHASLLTGLLQRGDEVEVVGVLPPGPLAGEPPVKAFVRPEDVGRADFYADLLERLQPDVVLMNHVANSIGVTHARLESPPGVGVVHSWHNITFRPEAERTRSRAVTQEALNGLTAMVAPSEHALAEGRELGFSYPVRAAAIHNPLPPHHMEDDIDVEAAERHGVVYLGGLIPRKDPLALVRAALLLPDLDVVFVGEGELEQPLRILIERLRLDGRVRLAGALPEADHLRRVRDLLLGAQVLCLPSRSESFGLVFAEALACGTPVVGFAPTLAEIRAAMGVEVGVPLERGSAEEIAAAIEEVTAMSWDREGLRRAALEAFGLERVTDRYVELMTAVTGPSATGTGGGR